MWKLERLVTCLGPISQLRASLKRSLTPSALPHTESHWVLWRKGVAVNMWTMVLCVSHALQFCVQYSVALGLTSLIPLTLPHQTKPFGFLLLNVLPVLRTDPWGPRDSSVRTWQRIVIGSKVSDVISQLLLTSCVLGQIYNNSATSFLHMKNGEHDASHVL